MEEYNFISRYEGINMKQLFIFVLLILISTINVSALNNGSYTKYGLCFEIPEGWNVAKESTEGNDTQIILSDGVSAIRVDLIKYSDQGIDQLMMDHLKRDKTIPEDSSYNCSWRLIYALVPWQANGAIGYYYKNDVIKLVRNLGCYGSGISITPDGVGQASIHYDCGTPPGEWLIAWTKPEYNEELIGVHALFQGDYKQIPFEWHGSSKNYTMQEPLVQVLTSFTRGEKPKASAVNLVDMV